MSFYREKFDKVGLKPEDISTVEDLPKLPVMTKLDIRQNFSDRVLARNIPASRRVRDITSGSTGTPLVFYLDTASWDYVRASSLLFLEWAGVKPGDRSVWFGGRSIKRSFRTRVSHLLLRHKQIPAIGFTAQNMRVEAERLARMKPTFIEGQASAIFQLAQMAIGYDIEIKPKALVSTAETMPSREVVEQAFHCPIFNRYGNREMSGFLAQNCPDGRSLHINTELCILEVVDNQGKPVGAGERGNIILTDLTNYAMPFIRYDPEDMAVAGGECSCGRGFPLLTDIHGRRTETLLTPEGRIITLVDMGGHLFRKHDYVDYFLKYQAEQNELDRVTFRFVPIKPVNDELRRRLHHDLRALLGEGIEINIEFVDDILPEAGGKQLVIKSSISR